MATAQQQMPMAEPGQGALAGVGVPAPGGSKGINKKYIKWGIAALVVLVLIIIVVVLLGKRCSNDFDCKFGQTCQSGWCKS